MYDGAGEFAFRIGIPGKSGVGGGIIAVVPDAFTVAVWHQSWINLVTHWRGVLP